MEKIVIGVPYELSIEPSIDIGEFNAEIIIKHDDYGIAIELKKMKGKSQDYTFIIPSKLKTLLKKSTVDYSIFVYKENARFDVDDGKIQFMDETDFKVPVKNNAKMRRVEEEKPVEKDDKGKKAKTETKPKVAKKTSKKSTPEPTSTPVKERHMSPEEIAMDLIDKQSQSESVVPEDFDKGADNNPIPKPKQAKIIPEKAPTPPTPKVTAGGNLQTILNTIEKRNQNRELNEEIQKAIRNEPKD
jgi:hypothetical protein